MRREGQFDATRRSVGNKRMISEAALLEFSSGLIIEAWERLHDVVRLARSSPRNTMAWKNVEYLYEYVKRRNA
jgi:hypothetical protein